MFAPAPRVVPLAPASRRAAPEPAPDDSVDGRGGDTRARVRLYGIRSEMAAARAAQELAAQIARDSAEQAARYARAAQQTAPVRPGHPDDPTPSQVSERLGTTQKRAPLNSVVPGAPTPVPPRSNHELDGMPAEQRPSARAPRGPHPVLVPGQHPRGEAAPAPLPAGAPPTHGPPVGYAPGPAAPAPRRRAVPLDNPFRRLVASDAAKDLGALGCLVLTLVLPWDAARAGHEAWWVVVPVVLALLALAVPYVMTARLVPAFRPAQSAVLKAALSVPLALAAASSVGAELLTREDGIGVGVAVALTAVALTAQPRRSEEVLGALGEGWLAPTAFVVGLLAVVLHVVAFPVYAVGVDAGGPLGWFAAVLGLLAPPVAVLGVPAVAHAMGRTAGRRVLVVGGLTCLTVTALAALGMPGLLSFAVIERLGGASGGAFLVGAAAALALSLPAVRRTGAGVDPVVAWFQTARLAFALAACVLVLEVLVFLSVLVFSDARPGTFVGAVVVRALAALLAVVTALLLVDADRRGAALLVGVTVPVLSGIGWLLSAAATPQGLSAAIGPVQVTAWFALPALGLWSLAVPRSVRDQARLLAARRVPVTWQPPAQALAWGAPDGPPLAGPALAGPPLAGPVLAGPPNLRPVPTRPMAPEPASAPTHPPLAAVPPLTPPPATFRPGPQPTTYVQSPGTTQMRRIPTGATPVPGGGQEWSGWRMPTAR